MKANHQGNARQVADALIKNTRTHEAVAKIPDQLVRIAKQPKNPEPKRGNK